MKTRSYFEEFLHLTNPRTLKEDVEIDVKEPVEDDTEAADGAVVAPIIDPEMGYDMGDVDDTQVEQDGSAYIGKSVVDSHVCNNAFFIDGMEIPEELVCPVCAAPAADLELVGIVEPIPEQEPATTDNNDEQGEDSDDEQKGDYDSEDSDEDNVGESAGKADLYKKAKMAESNKHISKLTEGYDDLTVRELSTILQDALDKLWDYLADSVIVTQPNTYGMFGNFISVSGKGYVELDNINIEDDEDMYDDEDMDESLKELKEEDSPSDRFEYEMVQGSGRNRCISTYHSPVYTPEEKNGDNVFIDILRTFGASDEQLERMQNSEGGFKGYLSRRKFNPSSSAPMLISVKDLQNGNFVFKHPQYEEIKEIVPMDESLAKSKAFPQVKKAQRASGVVKTNAKANINKGKSAAESREAMSKKIKDIYENRRAAQNTQVKKKSDLTNEAINPENAKDNAVLKNILLGRGNKKLSAEEQAVLDKYGFKASDGGGSKLITNPATDNTIYLHTTRNTYDLYLANKETHRRVGSFDKDSTDPAGLNAVDLIGFLNSESEPMRNYTTKAYRLNREINAVTQADIRYYQEIADKLEKRLKDAIDSNEDPDYIQKLQTRLDDQKKHLRSLQQSKGYSDRNAFAYRRYMDDTVNDNITAYKKLKRDLDYTQDRLNSAKNKIAASTSKWTIEQLQNQIAELQKQLDQALSGVGDEEDEQRVKDFEKRAQEIRAKIDDLFAKVKGSTGNK